MMAAWMVYATLVAALLAGGALALDRALRLTMREARWVWAVSLTASLVLPLLALRPAPATTVVELGLISATARAVASPVPAPSAALASLDTLLGAAWILASATLLLLFLASHRALGRQTAAATPLDLDGHGVRVTAGFGPAVVGGLWRPTIVMPAWITDLEPDARRLAVLHEAEHVARGDVRLFALATLAVVACPWNAALWWQLRRLRDAVELDCDRRLVRAGVDPRAYGTLLIEVTRRASRRTLAVALAGRPSLLSRRIDHMTPIPSRSRGLRATAAAALGGALVILACKAPGPVAEAENAVSAAVSLDVSPPVRISTPPIPYPPLLRDAGVEGTAVLEFVVDATGRVDSASIVVISADHPAFELPAVTAIKRSEFRPARADGVAVPQRTRQTIAWGIVRQGSPPAARPGADIQVTAELVDAAPPSPPGR